MTRNRHLGSALVALTLAACVGSDAPTAPAGPDPGTLTISLAEASDSDAGLLIGLSGAATTFTAAGGSTFWVRSEGSSHRLLVRGPLAVGPLVRFATPDRNGAYDVRVIEAAAGATGGYERLSPDAFKVRLSR